MMIDGMRILVTGGAGFIGSAVIRHMLQTRVAGVLNLDKLTYAGNPESLREAARDARYAFVRADICDASAVSRVCETFRPDAVLHLAAESHVDRSIDGPAAFMQTNIIGTYTLLEAARRYWDGLSAARQAAFRFQHISTDEVYGSLGPEGLFTDAPPYAPRSPYSASKAASDHLVMAWHQTYGLPVLITNCSNNYGPYHFPEKLIPLVILNALELKPLPIYGRGDNVRDWLYVDDHARALVTVLTRGIPGETYNVGGSNERTNLQVVEAICSVLDDLHPRADGRRYDERIAFVADRPGHDKRYAIDATKIRRELGWCPLETFETGIRKTVRWYLDNAWWWGPVRAGTYAGERLGLSRRPPEAAKATGSKKRRVPG